MWSVLVRGGSGSGGGSLWGGRFAQQGEPCGVDVQSTVQIRGPMLLVNVEGPLGPFFSSRSSPLV